MAEPYVFLGSLPSLVQVGVCMPYTAQHPWAQCPRDAERLLIAGLRAASPPHAGGAETEECQELVCYWSWEGKAKI